MPTCKQSEKYTSRQYFHTVYGIAYVSTIIRLKSYLSISILDQCKIVRVGKKRPQGLSEDILDKMPAKFNYWLGCQPNFIRPLWERCSTLLEYDKVKIRMDNSCQKWRSWLLDYYIKMILYYLKMRLTLGLAKWRLPNIDWSSRSLLSFSHWPSGFLMNKQ